MTVEECLQHPYLDAYHDPEDEPGAAPLDPNFFEFDLQKDNITREELKRLLQVGCGYHVNVHTLTLILFRYDEIVSFRLPNAKTAQTAAQAPQPMEM